MAFDTNPDNFQEDPQYDEELLELQKRKSVPAFVISEFVGADSEDSDEDNKNDDPKSPEEQFVK